MRYFAFVCSMVLVTACALNKYQQLDDLVSFEFSRTSCYGKFPRTKSKSLTTPVFLLWVDLYQQKRTFYSNWWSKSL